MEVFKGFEAPKFDPEAVEKIEMINGETKESLFKFVSDFESLQETLTTLTPEQVGIINTKIVELDDYRSSRREDGQEVPEYIDELIDRLGQVLILAMPEHNKKAA